MELTCKKCHEPFPPKAEKCPKCGADHPGFFTAPIKLRSGQGCLYLLTVIVMLTFCMHRHARKEGLLRPPPPRLKSKIQTPAYPSDQIEFHHLRRLIRDDYLKAQNDIQRAQLLADADTVILEFFQTRMPNIADWTAKITDIKIIHPLADTSIPIPPQDRLIALTLEADVAGISITYRTAHSLDADIYAQTLIPPYTGLHYHLYPLAPGRAVKFTASLALDPLGQPFPGVFDQKTSITNPNHILQFHVLTPLKP